MDRTNHWKEAKKIILYFFLSLRTRQCVAIQSEAECGMPP
jgi:hypothetical protein